MIYIAVCDDQEKSLADINDILKKHIEVNREVAEVTLYSKSELLKYDIEEGKHFDLILSDIEMPHLDGMQLASFIKNHLPDALVVFVTSYLKYAVDAFELSIFRYIPKDSMDERLPIVLKDAFLMIHLQNDDFYVIETSNRMEKIRYKNIVYIQKDGKNCIIKLTDGTQTKVRKSLTKLFNEIKQSDFVYVDRGTVVNLIHIMSLNNEFIKMTDGTCLYTTMSKLDELKQKISMFWRKQL